ncbi:MAG TPA: DUF4252 domain-containing protein [Opitutaceae bacterium]
MNTLRVSLLASLLSVAAFAATPEPGYVDFGKFSPSADGQFVEVNLQNGLLKFAATLAGTQEPEVAELLRNLKHVRVNVVGLDDANRRETTEHVARIRRELTNQGWTQIVTVKGGEKKAEDVAIYTKQNPDDSIAGIVITVIDNGREAVLVNIVGDIKPEQIATIAERLHIDPLKKIAANVEK